MFIFLGWFKLSVKNNKSSTRLIPITGKDWLKFKKLPVTKVTKLKEPSKVNSYIKFSAPTDLTPLTSL